MAVDQMYANALKEIDDLKNDLATSEAACASAMTEVERLTDATVLVRCEHPEMDVLIAERDAMRPVVEAAKAWRVLHSPDPCREERCGQRVCALVAAVDALSTKDGA